MTANARLIAAAPEMLACLREIVRDAPETEPEYGTGAVTQSAPSGGAALRNTGGSPNSPARRWPSRRGVEHPAAHEGARGGDGG